MPFKFNPFTRKLDITDAGGAGGDVVGPASSVDGNIVDFDGSTGKLIKDSGVSSTSPVFTGDVSTLSNFKMPQTNSTVGALLMNNLLFLHAGGGVSNTFVGSGAGNRTNASVGNTAVGQQALQSISGGTSNIAIGHVCGGSIVNGNFNTIVGEGALFSSGDVTGCTVLGWHGQILGSGNYNISVGYSVMTNGVSGADNIGVGRASLSTLQAGTLNVCVGAGTGQNLTTGSSNTIVGAAAGEGLLNTGSYNTILGSTAGNSYASSESSNVILASQGVVGESHVMRLGDTGSGNGQVNKAYVAAVSGVTVTGSAVLCAADGQLGTVVSSERYKKDVETLQSSDILKLRPVTFVYRNDEKQVLQVGLIAEEVEKIIPRLCVYDNKGALQSVKYHEICTYLLLEIQKLNERINVLEVA